MIFIKPPIFILAAVVAVVLVSCDGESEKADLRDPEKVSVDEEIGESLEEVPDAAGDERPKTHEEVVEKYSVLKEGFIKSLVSVVDPETAKILVAGLEDRKKSFRDLLEIAQSLQPPGPSSMALYQKHEEMSSEASAVLMSDFMARTRARQDSEEILGIIGVLSEDEEVDALILKFEELYAPRIEGKEGVEAK